MKMPIDSQIRKEFEKWCTIKITDAAKAPKAAALVQAYWNAWQAAYAAGRSAGLEECIEECDKFLVIRGDDAAASTIRKVAETIRAAILKRKEEQ